MKIVFHQKKDNPFYWELIHGNPVFVSPTFERGDACIDELEKFVTLIKSPVFIESDGSCTDERIASKNPATVVLKRLGSHWVWSLFYVFDEQPAKIHSFIGHEIKTKEQARSDAQLFCDLIYKAQIYDNYNVLLSGIRFSKAFATERRIKDLHPSSKLYPPKY